jgi:hypothetical protein
MMTRKEAWDLVGGLSKPGKMPWYAYSIPATQCKVGSKLALIEGTVCHGCYALKGRYMMPNVKDAMERRLASLQDLRWVDAMAFLLNDLAGKKPRHFRWHDSGDLQDISHLHKIIKVALRTPTIQHWLPTKEKALVLSYKGKLPPNLTIRISAYHIDHTLKGSGFPTSSVSTNSRTCPAYDNDGKCGSCRKCWDPSVPNVTYPLH